MVELLGWGDFAAQSELRSLPRKHCIAQVMPLPLISEGHAALWVLPLSH